MKVSISLMTAAVVVVLLVPPQDVEGQTLSFRGPGLSYRFGSGSPRVKIRPPTAKRSGSFALRSPGASFRVGGQRYDRGGYGYGGGNLYRGYSGGSSCGGASYGRSYTRQASRYNEPQYNTPPPSSSVGTGYNRSQQGGVQPLAPKPGGYDVKTIPAATASKNAVGEEALEYLWDSPPKKSGYFFRYTYRTYRDFAGRIKNKKVAREKVYL